MIQSSGPKNVLDKVIVIGCYVPGFAVVRALAAKNIPIVAMTYSPNDIANHSRHVSEVVSVPHPEKEPIHFVEFLLANRQRWPGALILENADHTSVVLSKYKKELSQYYRIVTPNWDVFSRFIDKDDTYRLAEECDVPHPRTFSPTTLTEFKEIPEVQFPCILKPVRSFEFVNRFGIKNILVNSRDELVEKFQWCLGMGSAMVIQEVIPGPDENLYKLQGYINSRGDMVGKFFHRKLRQYPPHFGVMRVGVSTGPDPEVEALTKRLLEHVNYQGYFSIEFKKDSRDGKLKLMENNCRLVRCGMLATASGVNYPWLIYQDLVKNQQIDVVKYKTETYWIELYADLAISLFRRREEEIRPQEYIRPYLTRQKVFAELDIHDMQPFTRLTGEKIMNMYRKVARYFRPARTKTGLPEAK